MSAGLQPTPPKSFARRRLIWIVLTAVIAATTMSYMLRDRPGPLDSAFPPGAQGTGKVVAVVVFSVVFGITFGSRTARRQGGYTQEVRLRDRSRFVHDLDDVMRTLGFACLKRDPRRLIFAPRFMAYVTKFYMSPAPLIVTFPGDAVASLKGRDSVIAPVIHALRRASVESGALDEDAESDFG